jgi:ABC-type nitrate/sulfonate/bicarbonate transport system substrate-binding protein
MVGRLADWGYQVAVVVDGEALLDALEAGDVDAALLAPDLPGAVAAAKLYRFIALGRAAVPLIGLAGGEQPGISPDELGLDAWLEGDAPAAQLAVLLNRLCASRAVQRP